jgi:3-dehydroquinate synthase
MSVTPVGERLCARFGVEYRYAVHFTRDVLDPANPTLADAVPAGERPVVLPVLDRGLVACHPTVPARLDAYARRHSERLRLAGPALVLPGGEAVKEDARHVEAILAAIAARAVDRHSYVLAVGGGALLDVAGYAAAVAHRGVRLLRVPTTTLAQNDAGVGVKNGVNAYGRKNFLGTFAPPAAVINDGCFLPTLCDRDWRAGAAEAVKVAVLCDADFFAALETLAPAVVARDLDAMVVLVRRCAELHVAHIVAGGDPFELGSARPLDFGHWAAHRLERLSGLELRHGEAVAVGMALDCTYARLAGLLPATVCARVLALLAAFGLPLYAPELEHPGLLDGLAEFRQHLGGPLTLTLASALGASVEVHRVDLGLMRRAVRELRAGAGAPREATATPATRVPAKVAAAAGRAALDVAVSAAAGAPLDGAATPGRWTGGPARTGVLDHVGHVDDPL